MRINEVTYGKLKTPLTVNGNLNKPELSRIKTSLHDAMMSFSSNTDERTTTELQQYVYESS